MVEEFSEFDKSHLAVLSGHFHYLTTEGLTERMGGEMLNIFQHILHLDFFEDDIYPLNGDYITVAVEEALLVWIFDVQCLITLPDMFSHTSIDLYLPVLSCLLLVDGKVLTEYLVPGKIEKITDAKPEERAAGNEKAHPVSTIFEQPVCQIEHCIPRQVVRCCV